MIMIPICKKYFTCKYCAGDPEKSKIKMKKEESSKRIKRERVMKRCMIFIALLSFFNLHAQSEWSWFYKKYFTEFERSHYQKELIFSKMNVPEFTQLIFSWNAYRPRKGFYSFWLQVRDVSTKQWYPWHKMIEWGDNIQKSYSSNRGAFSTKGCHVRLELPLTHFGDGFRVKVEAHGDADYRDLMMLGVCASNMNAFSRESLSSITQLPSVQIKGLPRISQMALIHPRAEDLCSPTSLSMVMSYVKKMPLDPAEFANSVYDQGLDIFGSWPFNTAAAFEACDGQALFSVKRLPSFLHLYQYLCNKIPVVVSVRGHLKGGAKVYHKGHLLVVIGWNQERKTVICHDPAFNNENRVLVEYELSPFLAAWNRSQNLAYITQPRS